jgi:hypothetical protein
MVTLDSARSSDLELAARLREWELHSTLHNRWLCSIKRGHRLASVSFSLLIDVDISPLFDVVSWAHPIKIKKRLYSHVVRKRVESAT